MRWLLSLKQCMSPIKICPTLPFYSFTFNNCIYIYIGSTWSLSRISYFVWRTSVVQFSSFTNICRIINIYVQYSKMWQYFPCCLAASVGLFNSQGKLVHSVNLTTAKTSTSKFSTPASPVLGISKFISCCFCQFFRPYSFGASWHLCQFAKIGLAEEQGVKGAFGWCLSFPGPGTAILLVVTLW